MALDSNVLFRGGLVSPVSSYQQGLNFAQNMAMNEQLMRQRAQEMGLAERRMGLAERQASSFKTPGTFNVQYPLVDIEGKPGYQHRVQLRTDPQTGMPISTPIPGTEVAKGNMIKLRNEFGEYIFMNPETGQKQKTGEIDADFITANKRIAQEWKKIALDEMKTDLQMDKTAQELAAKKAQQGYEFEGEMQMANEALGAIEQMIGPQGKRKLHPGLAGSVGLKSWTMGFGLTDPAPGSKEADFMALMDKIKGNAFLSAFKSLKGGGQITEIEGQKAESALLAASTAQSEEEFIKNMEKFRLFLNKGIQKAKKRRVGELRAEKPTIRFSTKPTQAPAGSDPLGLGL